MVGNIFSSSFHINYINGSLLSLKKNKKSCIKLKKTTTEKLFFLNKAKTAIQVSENKVTIYQ